jgi:Na+-driven multidrug efflux pump
MGKLGFLIRFMTSGKSSLKIRKVRLEWRFVADILKVGLPAALSTVMTNLIVIILTAAVGLGGATALAAFGIVSRLDYVMIPLLFGLSSAVLTMVGVNIGAGQVARARKITWLGVLVGAGFVEAIGVLLSLFPLLWLGWFTADSAVLGPATTYLHIVAPFWDLVLSLVLPPKAQAMHFGPS